MSKTKIGVENLESAQKMKEDVVAFFKKIGEKFRACKNEDDIEKLVDSTNKEINDFVDNYEVSTFREAFEFGKMINAACETLETFVKRLEMVYGLEAMLKVKDADGTPVPEGITIPTVGEA